MADKNISPDNPYSVIDSGIGFSNPYAADALPPEELQEQRVAEQMQSVVERLDSKGVTADDLTMAARAFIDGLWLNKADEVGSMMAATAVKLLNPELVQNKSISEIATEMKTTLEGESARFAEENPVASITANIAGSILSPVSLAGGQVLSQANLLRSGAKAAQAGDEVAATLGGQFGRQADKAEDYAGLLSQLQGQVKTPLLPTLSKIPGVSGLNTSGAAQTLSKIPTPVAASGFATAEGAIIGAEGDTVLEKAQNAAITAGISAAVPFAFAGVKKSYDFATETKLAQQLGEGKDFVNLMFTESGVAPFYRSVVSKAYGGRSLIEQQARRMFARTPSTADAKAAAKQFKEDAARKTVLAQKAITETKDETSATAQRVLDDSIAEAKLDLESAVGAEKTRIQGVISDLEAAKQDAKVAKALAVKEADAAVNAADGVFRGSAVRSAAPATAPKEALAELDMMDPQDANKYIDSLWKQYGFKVADNKVYELNPGLVSDVIKNASKKYPELTLVEGGRIVPLVTDYVLKQIRDKASDGVIRGKDLLQLRSDIGRAINNLSDDKTSTRRFASEIQEYFDDVLSSGLSKQESEEFLQDRYAWSIRVAVDEAIEKASGASLAGGSFTAAQFLDVIKSNSGRFSARGEGRLQQEAQEIAVAAKRNEQNILDLANQNAADIAKDVLQQKAAFKAQLEKTKVALAKERDKAIAAAKEKYRGTTSSAAQRAARDAEIAAIKEKHTVQMADLDTKTAEVATQMKAIAEMAPGSFRQTVFENLFNTSLVGQVVTVGQAGVKESLKSGIVGARILADESTQRFIAGQTKGQAALRNFVERTSANVPAGSTQSATAAAGTVTERVFDPAGVMYNAETVGLIENMPKQGKAALYRNLKAKGKLEQLKAENPELYKKLEKAAS